VRTLPPRYSRILWYRPVRSHFFHGQNVYLGQRSPIMRFFLFLLFFVFFQCTVRYPSNPLPPSYMTHTSSRIFWSFHTSYRVCLVPAESGDSNSACSAGAVAARRQNGVAVPHRGRRLEAVRGNASARRCRFAWLLTLDNRSAVAVRAAAQRGLHISRDL